MFILAINVYFFFRLSEMRRLFKCSRNDPYETTWLFKTKLHMEHLERAHGRNVVLSKVLFMYFQSKAIPLKLVSWTSDYLPNRDPLRAVNISMKKGMEPKKITLILHLLTDAILKEPIFKPYAVHKDI